MTTHDWLAAVKARADAATKGPWNLWEGPLYAGGGADLCIGAGEKWLANMDHRYGKDYMARVKHEHKRGCKDATWSDDDFEAFDCPICHVGDEVTKEQRANADFIAHAREDVPRLLAALTACTEALVECAIPYEALLLDKPSSRWIAPEIWAAMENAVEKSRNALNSLPGAPLQEPK